MIQRIRSYQGYTLWKYEKIIHTKSRPILGRRFSSGQNKHFEAIVPYNQRHVYSVVADIDSYSQFVPWCTRSVVIEVINPKERLADLTVGFMGFAQETFRSHVILDPFNSVTAVANSDLYSLSPLKSLKNVWRFSAISDDATKVSLELDFDFHNSFYTKIASRFFSKIADSAMRKFTERCAAVPYVPVTVAGTEMNVHANSVTAADERSFRGVLDTFKSLSSSSHFDEFEIETIARDFHQLAKSNQLAIEGLSQWLHHSRPEVTARLFEAMDADKNKTLTLREFVRGLSIIVRGSSLEKRFVWFRDSLDESISPQELCLAVECTLVTRDTLLMRLASTEPVSPYEKPDEAAKRLIAPVYREGKVNKRSLQRLFQML